ncbi:MAG: rubrerythrin-like domain-containing protein [Haloferacaceae archaeon]
MHGVEPDGVRDGGLDRYECLGCGRRLRSSSSPMECPDCGTPVRNLSVPYRE